MIGLKDCQKRTHHRTPVLLVENQGDSLPMLSDTLDDLGMGHSVIRISQAEEALAFLRDDAARKPTLIFVDGADSKAIGLEVLQWLKADDQLKSIPVIILGPSGDGRAINASFDLGAVGYIVKSPDAQGLIEAVRAIDEYWTLSQVPQID